jgi:hypothetical protein
MIELTDFSILHRLYLTNNNTQIRQIRSYLSENFHLFVTSGLKLGRAFELIEKFDKLLEDSPDPSLAFFIKTYQIKIKIALLNAGLIDAAEKHIILNDGITVCKALKAYVANKKHLCTSKHLCSIFLSSLKKLSFI